MAFHVCPRGVGECDILPLCSLRMPDGHGKESFCQQEARLCCAVHNSLICSYLFKSLARVTIHSIHLSPENKITLCEPHSRPLPQLSGLGWDQSTSGSFTPCSRVMYSMSDVQGSTLTASKPAASSTHLIMAPSSTLKPARVTAYVHQHVMSPCSV
jgi:hypothetical protein